MEKLEAELEENQNHPEEIKEENKNDEDIIEKQNQQEELTEDEKELDEESEGLSEEEKKAKILKITNNINVKKSRILIINKEYETLKTSLDELDKDINSYEPYNTKVLEYLDYGTKRIAAEFGFDRNLSAEQLWEKLSSDEEGIRFINAIERCKCDLSKTQKYKFSFIGKNIFLNEKSFYRENFTNAIEEKLYEISDLIELSLENGNIFDPYDIDHVILAGGSSQIPAVIDTLADLFGSSRVSSKITENDSVVRSFKRNKANESEVLTSIVRGLAMVGCKDEELIEDVVDCDYGVWDVVNKNLIPVIKKGIQVKETEFDKITKKGTYQEVECVDKNAGSVELLIFQHNLNGNQKLGTINIPNPGGMKYKVYMHIDRKKGMLVVTLYDSIRQRWIDEIPLNERTYIIK